MEFSYRKVENRDALVECLEKLEKCSEISLDLEFDRDRYAYGFTLCLIQVSDGKMSWLIDPMAGFDLQPLYRFLEKESPLKIMHAPGEDLTLLHQQGCFPQSIFDTERAARILDFEAFSLGALLLQCLDVSLDKSQQKTDWTRRPLRDQQWLYAARDVLFLPELKQIMLEKAIQKGVVNFIEEENLAWNTFRVEEKRPGWFVNKDDEKKLPPFYLHLYNAMMGLRDEQARKLNKPGYMIAPREALINLAFRDEDFQQWFQISGLHPSLRNDQAKAAYQQAKETARKEAESLRLERKSATALLSQAEREARYHERKRIEQIVEQVFRPIQQQLIQRFGNFAGTYMLNEKNMSELASGKITLSRLPYSYRNTLICDIAKNLGISLSEFS